MSKHKAIKKAIYGDNSTRPADRVYGTINRGGTVANQPDSPRARYQQAKKAARVK